MTMTAGKRSARGFASVRGTPTDSAPMPGDVFQSGPVKRQVITFV